MQLFFWGSDITLWLRSPPHYVTLCHIFGHPLPLDEWLLNGPLRTMSDKPRVQIHTFWDFSKRTLRALRVLISPYKVFIFSKLSSRNYHRHQKQRLKDPILAVLRVQTFFEIFGLAQTFYLENFFFKKKQFNVFRVTCSKR